MSLVMIILVAAVTFGVCFLVDKGYTNRFRSQAQHKTGLSVRLNKRYCVIGILVMLLSVAALIVSVKDTWVLTAAGCVLLVVGAALIVYYMTFGVFYDEDSFVLTTFGKKSVTYRFSDIRSQQLYNAYGNIVIELVMTDGRAVQLQAGMEGVYPFMDKAFAGWLRQKGLRKEDCAFYDPANSCWFPQTED